MTCPTEVNFTTDTKLRALARQDFLCGSCGSLIVAFNSKYKRRDGSTGTRWRFRSVAYEETAHGHHMQHANLHDRPGGPDGRGTGASLELRDDLAGHDSAHAGRALCYRNRAFDSEGLSVLQSNEGALELAKIGSDRFGTHRQGEAGAAPGFLTR